MERRGVARRDGGRRAEPFDEVATRGYFRDMRAVGIKTLKNKLSEYVRLAGTGEVILVTDRDRVVAELVSPSPGRAPLVADAALAEAVRKGWLTPPTLVTGEAPPRLPAAALRALLEELDEDRSAG
jgi:prevent-host-death family protein